MNQKKAIQISVFGIIFIISLILWNYVLVGKSSHGVQETSQATLPMITLISDGQEINQLHGYRGTIDASQLRDSVTPIDSNSLNLFTTGSSNDAVAYKLYDSDNKTVLDKGDVSFQKKSGKNMAQVQLDARLSSGKTYLLELSLEKDKENIKYYTRIIYGTGFHLKECLKFAQKFHNSALKEGNTEFVSKYLETKEGATSNDLSYVNLKSTNEAICYADMKPQVEKVYPPTVKEITQDVTSLEIRYIVSSVDTEGIRQYYQVNEYFRVRFSESRMYLLNYERSMESYMRYDSIDRNNNRILVGIGKNNKQLLSCKNGKKVGFVTGNELWYYDYQKSEMYKVFSFMGEDYRDSRNNYPKHGIQIMSMKPSGDMTFVVYGYMNRGKDEGKNGIGVYRFSAKNKEINELTFIETPVQYDNMKDDIGKGAYLSSDNQFYFYLAGSIYHVDIDNDKSEILAKHVTNDMAVITENGMLAINETQNRLKVMNLSTGKSWTISSSDAQIIKPIGFIEQDLVYGIGQKAEIVHQEDGTIMYPLSNVYIRDKDHMIKEYGQKGSYITDAKVDGTTVAMTRAVKKGKSYKTKDTTYIRYKDKTENKVVFEYGYSSTRLNQLYMAFPSNVYIQTRPGYQMIGLKEEGKQINVHFVDNIYKYRKAYVYTGGQLSGIYTSMKEAIKEAKQGGGIVVNCNQMYLWEKGVMKTYGKVANIPIEKAKTKDETDIACIKMMADSEGKNYSYDDIKEMKGNTFDKLFETFDRQAVNYCECSFDDVLYSIGKGRAIMAKRGNGTYILIISYNQKKLRYFDPIKGKSIQADRKSLESEFKKAGNVFYSYAK